LAKEDSQETTNAIVSNEPRLFVCDDKTSSAICGEATAITKKNCNNERKCTLREGRESQAGINKKKKNKRIKVLEVLMDLSFFFHDRPRHCR
jgi:hypothetical protein